MTKKLTSEIKTEAKNNKAGRPRKPSDNRDRRVTPNASIFMDLKDKKIKIDAIITSPQSALKFVDSVKAAILSVYHIQVIDAVEEK